MNSALLRLLCFWFQLFRNLMWASYYNDFFRLWSQPLLWHPLWGIWKQTRLSTKIFVHYELVMWFLRLISTDLLNLCLNRAVWKILTFKSFRIFNFLKPKFGFSWKSTKKWRFAVCSGHICWKPNKTILWQGVHGTYELRCWIRNFDSAQL